VRLGRKPLWLNDENVGFQLAGVAEVRFHTIEAPSLVQS